VNALHPDDVLLFHEVANAMRHVAKQYELPLRTVVPHPDCHYTTSPLPSFTDPERGHLDSGAEADLHRRCADCAQLYGGSDERL
jgi:hypothetical protein